jgi:catechol 2,3-dioxygenase-like lactoylglutathione lyase family enzyme
MSTRNVVAMIACCVAAIGSGPAVAVSSQGREPQDGPPTVIALASFGRSVANLDKAVAFYRDVLGMEVVEKTLPAPTADRELQKLTNTPGAKTRTVHLRVAYTPISLALTEFSGIDQKPIQGNPGQPGIPWLTLSLKDDASFAGIEQAHPPTFSLFGDRPPPAASGTPASSPPPGVTELPAQGPPKRTGFGAVLKMAFIRDADGFLVEVLHRDPKSWFTVANPIIHAEESTAPIPGPPVVGLQFVLWERSEDALHFYYDLLGFDIRPGYTRSLQELFTITDKLPAEAGCTPEHSGASMMNMADQRPVSGCWSPMPGPPGLPARGKGTRGVAGNCAGVRCEWFENDPAGKPFQPRIQDPGAGYLSLWVRDLDQLVLAMKAAGVEVITRGGKPVHMNGSRCILVRDLSGGFYVELMQKD